MKKEKDSFGNVQPAKNWFDRAYEAHLRKYYGWDQHFYRYCVWTVVFVIILSVLAPAIWFGRTAYRKYAENHDAEQAQSFLALGDYRNAAISAYATLRYNSNNVTACRVMSHLAILDHSPAALVWLGRVAAAEPTPANKLDLAAEGLVYQKPPFPLTAKTLAELPGLATNNPAYLAVAADLAIKLNHLGEAETNLELAVKLDPSNQAYVLSLAVLQTKLPDETTRNNADIILQGLGTNGIFGLDAMRALVKERLKEGDLPAAERYSTELLASRGASMGDELQGLGITKYLNKDRFMARLQSVQKAATNDQDTAQLSEWMQANGMLAENLRWLTNLPENLQARLSVRVALAQGYLREENWTALRDFAAKGNWEELEYLRLALVSIAFTKLGVSDVAENNWDAAVSEADRRVESLTKLYYFIKKFGNQTEAEKLLNRIAVEFPQKRWARQELASRYIIAGNTAALHDLSERLSTQFPEEPEWKNNAAATALLLRTNLPTAYQLAEDGYNQHPTNQNEIATYAYALHLQGRDQEGLVVMAKLSPAQIESPSVALYYGLLLAATGRSEEAKTWLRIAHSDAHLLPEEKQLLSDVEGK